MRRSTILVALALLWIRGLPSKAASPEIRPGVWADQRSEALPLPTQGYEAYVGEMHGVKENAEFQTRYLEQLHRASGLRDVALEERAVYENDAQAFADGGSNKLPSQLCLRRVILERIRQLNAGLKEDVRIRVHFTDIDSPAAAIRRHLAVLQQRHGWRLDRRLSE
jgi:hypothetical protein